MDITYFCPVELGEGVAAGAILQSEDLQSGEIEYIPMSLELEKVSVVHERGGVWMIEALPAHFPVFDNEQAACDFLAYMWNSNKLGMMTPDVILDLADILGGVWRDKSQYGYEIKPKPKRN